MTKFSSTIFVFLLLLSGCNILQNSAKKELSDGFYIKKSGGEKQRVYLDVEDDVRRMYPTTTQNKTILIDTLNPFEFHLTQSKTKEDVDFSLSKGSFDLDFLTVPAKLRFAAKDVPAQFNSELNLALFLGYRKDRYNTKYSPTPLNILEPRTTHFGYSVGLFTGFGNTFMSPTTTNDRLQQEYDGIVWSKGLAGIIGLNNFSVGLAFGFDNLLDKNNTIWIYENKPWIGIGLGLNLN